MINNFGTDPNWFGSSNRGKIPIGWTLSPALSELAPNIMDYLYTSATNTSTGSDTFVASPSGQGYMFPSNYTDNSGFATMLNKYLDRANMRIVNILDNGNTPIPSPEVSHYTEQSNVDGIIYYQFSDYSMLKGAITWSNKKPIIGGRANLWDGFNTPQQIAQLINNLAIQPSGHTESSVDAYSLIPVHAWSMNVDDVLTCAELFDSSLVRVVSPQQLV